MKQALWQQEIRRIVLAAGLLLALLPLPDAARAAPPAPFVMGTDADEATLHGKWFRRIYAEAFRRLDIPLEFAVYPLARLGVLADQGDIDGEALRVHGYGAAHPNLVRVEESAIENRLALYTANPALSLNRLEDLASSRLTVEYRRGVAICLKFLGPLFPPERIADVTTTGQGLRKLVAGRMDLYCDFDLAVQSALYSHELADLGPFRKAIDLGEPIPLYPYLHRKNAALAPRLADTLGKMKAEGLIERYRIEAEKEPGRAR